MNRVRNSAFSLIELMVVIGIVAILTAVAVPTYKGYLTKVQIAEFNQTMQGYLAPVAQFYSREGYFPNFEELGFESPILTTPSQIDFTSGPISTASYFDSIAGGSQTCEGVFYEVTITTSPTIAGNVAYYYIALPNGTIEQKCRYMLTAGAIEGSPLLSGVMSTCVDGYDTDAMNALTQELIADAESC